MRNTNKISKQAASTVIAGRLSMNSYPQHRASKDQEKWLECAASMVSLVALEPMLRVLVMLLPVFACAPKKYQIVQITNVHLHDSGAGNVDAYVTVQEGEFLFITDCGDTQRVTLPKAWRDGTKIELRYTKDRVYIRNLVGKDYACDLLGKKHAPLR
jgi:hypothetical protein